MALTIDNLEIQIEANASKSSRGINALAKSLSKLQGAVGDTSGVASNLQQIATALQKFSSVGKLNMKSKVTQLQKLNELVPTLGGGQGTQLATNLREIADGLMALSAVPKLNVGVGSLANGIQALNTATASFDATRLAEFSTQMRGIADGLSQLSNVGKNGVSSTVNALQKIPEITKNLDTATIDQFASTMARLTEIMSPLAEKMDMVGRGFAAMPSSIRKANKAMNESVDTQKKLKSSHKGLLSSLADTVNHYKRLYGAARSLIDIFSDLLDESNSYVEALNLFTVSMGEASDEAMRYAKTVSDAMGIDVAEWITKQGTFMRTMTGFGVAADEAELMSKNLTQLGYDLASFFNVSTEEAFDRLQSGMTGQIKGLKDYGLNLSVAALQETAWRLGIKQSVRTMTEAQKAQLRYITLLQNSNGIMGDMAKTIMTPANSMRILGAQITRMQRALGNLVSVIAVKVIPWIMALVEIIEEAATALAEAWGYELPELPENDLKISADTEELEEAEKEAEELKRQLMGFDELNILKSDKGENENPSYSLGIELPEYDFLNGLEGLDLEPIKKILKEILEIVGKIAAGLLAWKIASNLLDTIHDIKHGLDNFKAGTIKKSIGIALMITGFALEFDGAYDLGYEGPTLWNIVKTALGAALGIAGSLVVFGTGPLGWAVGIGLALTVGITGYVMGANKAMEEIRARIIESIAFDGEGIDIGDVAVKVTASISSVEVQYDSMHDTIKLIQNNQEAVDEFVADYNNLFNGIKTGVRDAVETLPELTEAFKAMYDSTKETLTAQHDLIIHSLSGATGEALKDVGADILAIKDAFNRVHENMITDLDGYNKEYDKITTDLKNGTISVSEACDQLEEAREKFSAVLDATGVSGPTTDADFRGSVFGIFDKIDLKSVNDVKKAFETVGTAAKDSIGEITAYYEELNKAEQIRLDYAIETGDVDAAEKIKQAMTANITARDNAISEITGYYQGMIDEVFANLFASLPEIAENAGEEYDNLPWWKKLLTRKSEFIKQAIEEYRDNTIIPITDGIKGALGEELTREADVWGAGAISDFINKAFATDTITNYSDSGMVYSTTVTRIAGDFGDALDAVLPDRLKTSGALGVDALTSGIEEQVVEVTPALTSTTEGLGGDLADGLYNGVEAAIEEDRPWYEKLWNSLIDWFKNIFGIHSPSTVFEGFGINIIQGLWNGLKSMWESLKAWWNKLELPSLKFKMPHFEWDYKNPLNIPSWVEETLDFLGLPTSIPRLKVNWYANGGFPSMGEMFIARESGPELVGRIGGKTAVANNDQITQGIASAVYSAMMAAQEDGNSGGGTSRIIVQIGDQAVGEASVRYINGQIVQTGASPIYT